MSKRPTLPLYYNDIARSTSTWTDEEFGCYMRLLMEQWDKGSLPNDCQRLARLVTSFEKNWPMLQKKFELKDGVFQNLRMEEIRQTLENHKKKQKVNAEKRYQNAAKPYAKPYAKHTAKKLPLEDEDENENEEELNSIKGTHLEFSQGLLSDDMRLSREAIELQTKVFITNELLKVYNAHLITENRTHPTFADYCLNLRNWIPKRPGKNTGKQITHPNISDNDHYENSESAV